MFNVPRNKAVNWASCWPAGAGQAGGGTMTAHSGLCTYQQHLDAGVQKVFLRGF